MLAAIRISCLLWAVFVWSAASAQTFVRLNDPQNEAAVTPGQSGYRGCAWVDYDNDGDEDLWVNRNLLYRNEGAGVLVNSGLTFALQNGLGSGCTWADYDNDGDLDLYISESPHSMLYRNDGGTFTAIDSGDIGFTGHDYRAWSCAWGDYDADGSVDLVLTHPVGFLGNPGLPNFVFHNDGPPDYTFTRIATGDIVTGLDAYTIGSFADFDLDGDLDFNIGSGPVTTPGTDHFYLNTLRESGTAELIEWNGSPLTDEIRDGQNINWIDIENDGDLDCYITNYTAGFNGGRANDLYRNDNGNYVRVTEGAIVTDRQTSLGNCWADFDQDGFVDCVVANETGTNKYYRNLGDGTFESRTTTFTVTGAFRCPAAGDYDNDGDLDLFITAVGAAQSFYRNDPPAGNHWIKLKLVGTESNRAAIGAVVRAKASINGQPMWQLREVNAQNSFNGHSTLLVHFGLGTSAIVDSLEIVWPSGLRQAWAGLDADMHYTLVEGEQSSVGRLPVLPRDTALSAYPNPFNSSTTIQYRLKTLGGSRLEVVDIQGREVWRTELSDKAGRVQFDGTQLGSGVYFVRIAGADSGSSADPLKLHLIK
ncbi:MAG: VCBS repeat-containing protein [Calditrichaeota bacterium]|nr:VCBS repeat-containing protein [Calditrichota bacterium]